MFSFNLPGYQYCGPNTIHMNTKPKNILDEKCKEHDLSYYDSNDRKTRCEADRLLMAEAGAIFKDPRLKLSLRFAAWIVYITMKLKIMLMCF